MNIQLVIHWFVDNPAIPLVLAHSISTLVDVSSGRARKFLLISIWIYAQSCHYSQACTNAFVLIPM